MIIKFFTAFILTILMGYAAFLYNDSIPWWAFAIAAFIVGIAVPQKAWLSWLTGFIGMFVCWGILAFSASSGNQHLLAGKMANILPLGGSVSLIVIITAFVAAMIGGFAALTGTYLRKQ